MRTASFPDQNRPDRAVISMRGENVLAFLNNLLTCEVGNLPEGQAAYGALLSPQGKILHDMFVYNTGFSIVLDCALDQRAALVQKLALYRLRAKLMIELDNDLEVGVHAERPEETLAFPDPRSEMLGWRSFAPSGTYINVPGSHGYDECRIGLGLADSVQDMGVEKLFPHEVNFDQMPAVSFTKGCYVGQEVVSRMQHRGTARSRMLPVTAGQILKQHASITSNGKTIGEVLSSAGNSAVALIRIDRLAEATAPLMSESVQVKITVPPWVKYAVSIPDACR